MFVDELPPELVFVGVFVLVGAGEVFVGVFVKTGAPGPTKAEAQN